MILKFLLLIIVFINLENALAGFYNEKTDRIVDITPKNAAKYFEKEPLVVLAEFYAPWCGHCQRLTPAYKLAAKKLAGLAKVVAVNCDEETNKPLCGQHGIQGFPTLKLFKTTFSTNGQVKKFAIDFKGPRAAKDIVDATLAAMPSRVVALKSKQFAQSAPAAILIPKSKTIPPLWKSLSVQFPSVQFGALSSDEKETIKSLISDLPKSFVAPGVFYSENFGSAPFVPYNEALKLDGLKRFFGTKVPSKQAKPDPETVDESPKFAEYNVTAITTQKQFNEDCLQSSGVCVLAFVTLEPEYAESLEQFNQTLALLNSVQKWENEQKSQALFHLHYINILAAGQQLTKDLNVPSVYPTAVAIQSKKGKYVPLRGTFDQSGLQNWLDSIRLGKLGAIEYKATRLVLDASNSKSDEL